MKFAIALAFWDAIMFAIAWYMVHRHEEQKHS